MNLPKAYVTKYSYKTKNKNAQRNRNVKQSDRLSALQVNRPIITNWVTSFSSFVLLPVSRKRRLFAIARDSVDCEHSYGKTVRVT